MAIDALLATLDPQVLRLPPAVLALIPPRPPGHPKNRETFSGNTGINFDEMAPARSAISLTLDVLLNPERAARMTRNGEPDFVEVLTELTSLAWGEDATDVEMQRLIADTYLTKLMQLGVSADVDVTVRSLVLATIGDIYDQLDPDNPYHQLAIFQIERMGADPAGVESIVPVTVPPGSPIGTTHHIMNDAAGE